MNASAQCIAPEELMAFFDGELSPTDAHSVSAHVKTCATCAGIPSQIHSTSEAISRWTVPALPAAVEKTIVGFAATVSGALKSAKTVSIPRGRYAIRRRWPKVLAYSSTFLVLALVVSVQLNKLKPAPLQTDGFVSSNAAPNSAVAQLESKTTAREESQPLEQPQTVPLASSASPSTPPRAGEQIDTAISIAPMIARTVSLSIVAKDFAASRSSLDAILTRHHGYFAQLTVNTSDDNSRSVQASLRIPAPELTSALAELKNLGHVQTESQTGDEVTQQHMDLVARLKNLRETEQRFIAILQQRTGKVSDVLQVEQEIARVRGEIEQMEADQKALEHRVGFATVDLQLNEEYKAQLNSNATSRATQFRNAFVAGYRNASEAVVGIALFIVEYGPVTIIWLGILLAVPFLLWRRYRKAIATT